MTLLYQMQIIDIQANGLTIYGGLLNVIIFNKTSRPEEQCYNGLAVIVNRKEV